ncbi:hypothetical protein ACFVZ4_30045 [Streptomyces goshikiensis]|uniref:hypothetical protein n=1 Tax=Streptomyces goshikiensis TaxID=1942 RepID=UPI00369CBC01
MSHLHSDPGFADARLAEALRELVDTYGPLPDRDIHGGLNDWRLLLVPPTAATDVVPTGPATVTVDVGLDVTFTVTAGARPAGEAVAIEENPYAIPLPPEILRPLTRIVMDLVHHEAATREERGLCQFCGKGSGLSIWRPR